MNGMETSEKTRTRMGGYVVGGVVAICAIVSGAFWSGLVAGIVARVFLLGWRVVWSGWGGAP